MIHCYRTEVSPISSSWAELELMFGQHTPVLSNFSSLTESYPRFWITCKACQTAQCECFFLIHMRILQLGCKREKILLQLAVCMSDYWIPVQQQKPTFSVAVDGGCNLELSVTGVLHLPSLSLTPYLMFHVCPEGPEISPSPQYSMQRAPAVLQCAVWCGSAQEGTCFLSG